MKVPPQALGGGDDSLQLLRLFQGGDLSAGDALLQRYSARIRGWATGRIPPQARSMGETGDLVGNILFRLYRSLPKFQPTHDRALAIYIRKAVLNEIRTMVRDANRRPRHAELRMEARDSRPSPAEELIGREALQAYDQAIDRLSEADQFLIHLKVDLSLSNAEIMKATGKSSPDAARVAVSRAIDRLAREMSKNPPR